MDFNLGETAQLGEMLQKVRMGQGTDCGSLSPLCGAVLQTVWDQASTQLMWASILVLVVETCQSHLQEVSASSALFQE